MNGIEPLLRLKALQRRKMPVTNVAAADVADQGGRLARLLNATLQVNNFGEHLRRQAWFVEPSSCTADLATIRLLVPAAPESVADPEQWLFLDTETTGLAGGTGTYAFLVGLAWWEGGGLRVEQLFMRDHGDEASLLTALAGRMSARPILVTFNGKSFDWPLLETRFRMSRSIHPPTPLAHIDFLYPARALWRLRLGSVRLEEIERHVLGLNRADDVPSASIPRIYLDFVRGGPCEPLVPIFSHNEMDLRSLAALSGRILSTIAAARSKDTLELFGLSRFYERRGDVRARQTYEQCVDGVLPEEADRAARQSLARLAKRDGDLTHACEVWQATIGDSREGYEAYEQLAIYHEHRAGNSRRAIDIVHAALGELNRSPDQTNLTREVRARMKARFEHRLVRLQRKTKAEPLFASAAD